MIYNISDKSKISNGNVFDNIYIYFYNTDYCISMTNANTADSYYDVNISEYGITKAEWLKILQEKQSGKYTVFSSDTKDTITYFYSVYSVERFVPFATIAIVADSKKLMSGLTAPAAAPAQGPASSPTRIIGKCIGKNVSPSDVPSPDTAPSA